MNKLVSTVALLAIATNFSLAGGYIHPPVKVMQPIEVQQPDLIVDEDIHYDGLYIGMAGSKMSMNEAVTSSGYALSFVAGYYFNKYFGLESRYTRTIVNVDVDHGAEIVSEGDVLENIGIYFKPMFNLTAGFSFYGLAGYGKSTYEKLDDSYSEEGFQWGLGAKYELAEGFGLFVDYLDIYSDDDFDGIIVDDIAYGVVNIGTTYTF